MSLYERLRIPLRAMFTLLSRVRIDGAERLPASGGVVIVSNHLCMIDPVLLGVTFNRQLHFMAKEEIFAFTPLGRILLRIGTFPVRRGEADRAALRHAEGLLKEGKVVMIFPEGHRSGDTGAQAARTGAVMLAARAGCPVLPVAITGTEALRFQEGALTWCKHALRRPRVRVRVGAPLHLDGSRRGPGHKANAEQVMRQIVSLLPPAYHGVYADQG